MRTSCRAVVFVSRRLSYLKYIEHSKDDEKRTISVVVRDNMILHEKQPTAAPVSKRQQ